MKFALAAALAVACCSPAFAQSGTNIAPGQTPAGINQLYFSANSDPTGFGESALATAVVAAGTTQATATLLTARTSVITSCPAGTGVELPSVERYMSIVVLNRSGASCLVYPSPNATVESAPGTVAALNAGVTVLTATDTLFRPVSAAAWLQ